MCVCVCVCVLSASCMHELDEVFGHCSSHVDEKRRDDETRLRPRGACASIWSSGRTSVESKMSTAVATCPVDPRVRRMESPGRSVLSPACRPPLGLLPQLACTTAGGRRSGTLSSRSTTYVSPSLDPLHTVHAACLCASQKRLLSGH